MNKEEHDKILGKLIADKQWNDGFNLLSIPGVYEIVSTYFTTEIIKIWTNGKRQQHNP